MSRPDHKNSALQVLTGLAGDTGDLEQAWLEVVTGQTGHVNGLYSSMYALADVDGLSSAASFFSWITALDQQPTPSIRSVPKQALSLEQTPYTGAQWVLSHFVN